MFNYEGEGLERICTVRQLEVLRAYNVTGSQRAAAKLLNCSRGKITNALAKIKEKSEFKDLNKQAEEVVSIKDKITDLSDHYNKISNKDKFTIVITSAQNSTPPNANFLSNLENLTGNVADTMLVIPFRYKNPTSTFTDSAKDYWDKSLHKYLCEDDFELCENLKIAGSLKTQPTAIRPLTGLEDVSGDRSLIIGHTKLELKCIATPSNRLPKILASTGCCTDPNYTDSTAGYKGTKRHTLSALVVSVNGSKFFIRQVIADKQGNFIDMLTEYKNSKMLGAPQASVLSTGDLHAINMDKQAVDATFFNKDSMVNYFKPKYITVDDSLDFQCASHHNKKDPVVQFQLHEQGLNNVREELKSTYSVIDKIAELGSKVVIKRSNHDEHLDRWVKETDPRFDPINSRIWCDAYLMMIDGIDPYSELAKRYMKHHKKVKFLERDEPFVVGGVSHDGHGDLGTNGSRGSLQQFTKLGSPGQWGHSHTAGIMNDQFQNGTLSILKLKYVRGPSSWMHCNTIQYANHQRSLMFIIDGQWYF